ncbi:MAG: asparagine synthase (glutamine-hydrolyzing) [Pseudobacteriovorax sp.]|nr:asparagine synthase (glutamine-hydrolyzing) [Pseudobacteriovorax sp.]
MCGISGVFHLDGKIVASPILKRMNQAIAHRGPDDSGIFVDGSIGLGHRRLSILDLSPAGHQPMQSPDGRFVMSYNGEIYNFLELRAELESLGHKFYSQSDSEVVLKSFVEWGSSAALKFNGMFAFVIWDKKEKKLFLCRDRFGVKPLYYAFFGSTLLFASEAKAIKQHPDYRHELDESALIEYLSFQNFFHSDTLDKAIKVFPAGYTGNISLGEGDLTLNQFWDFSFHSPRQIKDQREYVEELDRLFQQAVNRQLLSDVEVGSYLSGGIDSGSIASIVSRSLPDLKTFTVGFDLSSASGLELAFDERVTAEAMSYAFKTEQYEMVLKAGDMERALPSLVRHLEEPRVGQSYPNFYVARLASKFCKVALAGTGGDEIFGGYPWRYYGAVVNKNVPHYLSKYYSVWDRILLPNEKQGIFKRLKQPYDQAMPFERFSRVYPCNFLDSIEVSPEEYLKASLYFEAKTFLHGLLLVEDKLSMAHSLEARVPFLDNDLVDFAMNLPVPLKLGKFTEVVALDELTPGEKTKKYFTKSKDGKQLLRETMTRYIPSKITEAKKQGFSAPDASWFKGDSIEYVKNRLLGKNSPLFEVLDRDTIYSIVGSHINGKQNRRLTIWSLLYLSEYLQTV